MHNGNLKTDKNKQIGRIMRAGRYITAITLALSIHGMALSYATHKKEIKSSLEQNNNALQLQIFQMTKATEQLKEPVTEVKKPTPKKNKVVATDTQKVTQTTKKEMIHKPTKKPTKKVLNKNKTPIKDNKTPLPKTKVEPEKNHLQEPPTPTQKTPDELTETTEKEKKESKKTQPAAAEIASSSKPKLIEKPKFSAKPTPVKYPKLARKRGWQGQVMVEVWINAQGQQTKQIIIHSAGHKMLDQAALKAIKNWQFSSSTENQKAVAHRVRIPVNFQLK